ncbi:hypothetical protein P280DRAFT_521786 [Massarina eburnea CBS 473.64]|uniref:Uncharacterized protein n=1 Tax=Massarina eburnea CBS 473.64 TaxID=1395130 RepID=A0A6A6RRL2_9PLEO|nr:hypothetical protein P280DRAFT_521786 [Massarina eburnea CBS 473.64]
MSTAPQRDMPDYEGYVNEKVDTALRELIEKYRGVYGEGSDVLHSQWLQISRLLGLAGEDVLPRPMMTDEVKAWDSTK